MGWSLKKTSQTSSFLITLGNLSKEEPLALLNRWLGSFLMVFIANSCPWLLQPRLDQHHIVCKVLFLKSLFPYTGKPGIWTNAVVSSGTTAFSLSTALVVSVGLPKGMGYLPNSFSIHLDIFLLTYTFYFTYLFFGQVLNPHSTRWKQYKSIGEKCPSYSCPPADLSSPSELINVTGFSEAFQRYSILIKATIYI